jgi:hypothetical protein
MAKKPVDQGKVYADEIERLHDLLIHRDKLIERQRVEIQNLHHQAIGYDAVLDFLWAKLEAV